MGEERVLLREEDRTHTHIIGTTQEGKSYLLLQMMIGDVQAGNGLCFLDPSDNADTLYKFLSYLHSINFKKVVVIDPLHSDPKLFGKVAPINPFLYRKHTAVANILDTLRVLYQQKDWSQTPIIRRYLKAILSVMWEADCTLSDAVYFTEGAYINKRMRILDHAKPDDRQRLMIESAWKNAKLFIEYQSTVRRLEELFHPALEKIFNRQEGLNFTQLIADKWVILVNLYPAYGIESIHMRLLGTMVINEIISGIDSLKKPRLKKNGELKNPWEGRFYLYVDECGQFANEKLIEMMTLKAKSGLFVTVAHQFNDQFPDKNILRGIQGLAKTKIAFNQPDPTDRLETVKALYGGELADRDVSSALKKLRKQHCVIALPKQTPRVVRIHDLEIPKVNLGHYLSKLYEDPIYSIPNTVYYETKVTPEEVVEKLDEDRGKDSPSPKQASKTNRRATSKGGLRQPQNTHKGWEGVS